MTAAIERAAITEGALTRTFEAEVAAALEARGAVATSSCTTALVLALRALDVKAGDHVLVPSYTCEALLHAVAMTGAETRLADSTFDPVRMDYNLAPESARAKLTPRTRAVIVPHMFGVAAQIDEIVALGVPVIEDVTLSLGAPQVGTRGAVTVSSFHASKMIACGEGGALLTRDAALLARARHLNGWEDEQAAARVDDAAGGPYELRYNFHMTDVAAALGSSQLRKLPAFIARRRALAKRYHAALSGLAGVTLPAADGGENLFFRFLVSVRGCRPADVIRAFAAAGIEAGRGVFPPLHRFTGEPDASFPGAMRAVESLVSIPLYPALSDEEVQRVLDVSSEVLGRLCK